MTTRLTTREQEEVIEGVENEIRREYREMIERMRRRRGLGSRQLSELLGVTQRTAQNYGPKVEGAWQDITGHWRFPLKVVYETWPHLRPGGERSDGDGEQTS